VLGHQSQWVASGWIAIAGTSATTTRVDVRLSSAIRAGAGVAATAAGTVVTYNLGRGDVVLLSTTSSYTTACTTDPRCGLTSCALFCPYNSEDLTGTTITSTAPVAVFSGVDCSNIAQPNGTCPACDHLEEQLFPSETWGREVAVTQFRDRAATEPYIVRIFSRENANTVTFTPSSAHATVTLNRGESVEFCSTADFIVSGSQPFEVGQYMTGQNQTACGTCSTAAGTFPTDGDPSFVIEVPTAQYRRDYNFVVPNSYTANFINVVGRTGARILLDGTALTGIGTAIPGTAFSVWRQSVTAGSHQIVTSDTAGFGLKVSGVARYTSYAYPGGLDLAALP
jgi:hypothetical protein